MLFFLNLYKSADSVCNDKSVFLLGAVVSFALIIVWVCSWTSVNGWFLPNLKLSYIKSLLNLVNNQTHIHKLCNITKLEKVQQSQDFYALQSRTAACNKRLFLLLSIIHCKWQLQ